MPSRLYGKYKKTAVSFSNAGLGATIDVATDTIKCALVGAGYTPNTADTGDQFYSSVSANVIGTPVALTFASDVSGLYKATIPVFASIPGPFTITQLVIYKDTGVAGTSPLIGLYDGTIAVTAAALASIGATTITVDPLTAAIASGTAITFTGGCVATLSAAAVAGARSITVNATTGFAIAAGATGSAAVSGSALPTSYTGPGLVVTITPDVTNGWFTI